MLFSFLPHFQILGLLKHYCCSKPSLMRLWKYQFTPTLSQERISSIQGGIILAIPYFGYSRQDKRFKWERWYAKSIGRMLSQKCDGIVVLDLHAPEALADMEIPISYASAMPKLQTISNLKLILISYYRQTKELWNVRQRLLVT